MKTFEVHLVNKLTPREMDVINVMHYGRKNDLGLSPEYFQEVLTSARKKLGEGGESHKTIKIR